MPLKNWKWYGSILYLFTMLFYSQHLESAHKEKHPKIKINNKTAHKSMLNAMALISIGGY